MNIFSVLQLFGGVGLFLFGMSLMGDSLEKLAGSGLEHILEKLTTGRNKASGRIKGWGLGLAVTGIIQSSAATTIMLIGFVNAGIMRLTQAVPVVFGANVGSCVTAQILRLGDLGSGSIVLELLKPSSFAPMLCAVSAFVLLLSNNKQARNVASILMGLGILFYGMTMMEEVFEPLKNSPSFQKLFVSFSNPFIGILVGLAITAVIQSSSASVGILQALSATGQITYATAIPIIIGQNIGKCSAIVLGAVGANKKARRVSLSYILFNVFGALLWGTVIYLLYYTVGLPFMDHVVNRGQIANFHGLFNLVTSIILLPFTDLIVKFSEKIIGKDESKSAQSLQNLDEMLLNTPTIALEQCKKVIYSMADSIVENYDIATGLLVNYDENARKRLNENENFIDKCETELSSYIMKINAKRLTADENLIVSEILNSINDFERMGDYCVNIAYDAEDMKNQNIHFSEKGKKEIDTITDAVKYCIDTTISSFTNDDEKKAAHIEPLADAIDKLRELIKDNHVERLKTGECSVPAGVILIDLITAYERISSHCSNIALHVVKRVDNDRNFDEMHGHTNDNYSVEYKALYQYYENKYVTSLAGPDERISEYENPQITDKNTGNSLSESINSREKGKKTGGHGETAGSVHSSAKEKGKHKGKKHKKK